MLRPAQFNCIPDIDDSDLHVGRTRTFLTNDELQAQQNTMWYFCQNRVCNQEFEIIRIFAHRPANRHGYPNRILVTLKGNKAHTLGAEARSWPSRTWDRTERSPWISRLWKICKVKNYACRITESNQQFTYTGNVSAIGACSERWVTLVIKTSIWSSYGCFCDN